MPSASTIGGSRAGDDQQERGHGQPHRAAGEQGPRRISEERRHSARERVEGRGTHPIEHEIGGEHHRVDARERPDRDDREDDGDGGEHARGRHAQCARLRNEPAYAVEQRDVPGHEQLHARHHAAGEQRRWRDVREMLELANQRARAFQLAAARGAAPDVRLQGRRPESDLAVQQQVDLFRQ
jgi:hypothetical protein